MLCSIRLIGLCVKPQKVVGVQLCLSAGMGGLLDCCPVSIIHLSDGIYDIAGLLLSLSGPLMHLSDGIGIVFFKILMNDNHTPDTMQTFQHGVL